MLEFYYLSIIPYLHGPMIIPRITTRIDFEFCSTAFKTRESKDLEYRRSMDRAQILWKLRDREQRADAQNAGQRRHLSSYYLYVCSLVFRLENLPSLISACLKIRNDVVEPEDRGVDQFCGYRWARSQDTQSVDDVWNGAYLGQRGFSLFHDSEDPVDWDRVDEIPLMQDAT